MRLLVLLLLILATTGCRTDAREQAGEFDIRVSRSIDSFFYQYVADARAHLQAHDLSCVIMRDIHDQTQVAFEFVVVQLDGYHSRLKSRLDELATSLNRLRADIWAARGCIPSEH